MNAVVFLVFESFLRGKHKGAEALVGVFFDRSKANVYAGEHAGFHADKDGSYSVKGVRSPHGTLCHCSVRVVETDDKPTIAVYVQAHTEGPVLN